MCQERDDALMKKEVTIIIPTYNDTYKSMNESLNSIVTQDYNLKLIEVIIIDDGSDQKKFNIEKVKNKYTKLDIKYFGLTENKGPGLARQVGLDNASGEFIFFLDCGDYLYDNKVIRNFNNLKKQGYDIYSFYVNSFQYKYSFVNGNANIFGIFIRRKFIEQHHIKFSDILRWEEDSYFELVLKSYSPRIYPSYLFAYYYSYDVNSITRKDNGAYILKFVGHSAMIIRSILVCKNYLKETKRNDLLIRTIIICYATMYKKIYIENDISEIASKVLYLLRCMIKYFDMDTSNKEFFYKFESDLSYYRSYTHLYATTTDIKDFLNRISTQENLYGDYQIEGTNVTLYEFLNKINLQIK